VFRRAQDATRDNRIKPHGWRVDFGLTPCVRAEAGFLSSAPS
jgi:hypothetical protein